MEYLSQKPSYKRCFGDQNGKVYTVQLTKNYRNNAEILEIANKLFYDNTLEAFASGKFFRAFSIRIPNEIPSANIFILLHIRKVQKN